MGTHPIFESDFDCLTEMGRINFDDYDIYNGDYNYGSAYESSPEESFYFPRGQTFDFSSLQSLLNIGLLQDRIKEHEPSIFEKILAGDQDDELEEQYDVDHMQNIITNFRLSFPVSEDLDVISTTPSPLPKFFIITWKYNPVSEDYDRELETDSPILGDFLEDKEPSDYDFSSFNEDDWYVDGSTGRLWKNTEGDDIYEETDLMIGHFPLHYILVCFGFSLMIALLFMTRRRQIAIARQRHIVAQRQHAAEIKITIGTPIAGKAEAPPAYDDAIKMPVEKDEMLPKYGEQDK